MNPFRKKSSSASLILTNHNCKKLVKNKGSKKKRINADKINVMVFGNGGREHALVWKLIKSPLVNKCYVLPGNGGTDLMDRAINLSISVSSFRAISELIDKYDVSLIVIGQEKYLERGLVNYLQKYCPKVLCFGPTREASRIEWSKAFAKEFMYKHSIPTADFKIFYDHIRAIEYLKEVKERDQFPIVIKASGLAGGKGVSIVHNYEEGYDVIKDLMIDKKFGDSGNIVVIEEYLRGEEISLLGFTDSVNVTVMPLVRDYKRLCNYNYGPNTGGMGAWCNGKSIYEAKKYKWILQKAIDGLRQSGIEYKGVLYAGLMKTIEGIKVLEYNSRLGDPETQVLMPLFRDDLAQIMIDCCLGQLNGSNNIINWSNLSCLGVVLANEGYCSSDQGLILDKPITFNQTNDISQRLRIFHSGTTLHKSNLGMPSSLKINGGRIMTICATSFGLESARQSVYSTIDKVINVPNCQFRTDIGQRPLNVIILASGNGTNLRYLLNKINHVPINIIKVIVDRREAGVVSLCHFNNIPVSIVIKKKTETCKEYDQKLLNIISQSHPEIDMIMLISWMRMPDSEFVHAYEDKIYNIHPSLLPKFSDLMDMEVHKAVIKSEETMTGCTIHLVGCDIDKIVIQDSCPVYSDDSPEKLKARVQNLEGQCWIKLIQNIIYDRDHNYLPAINYSKCGVDLDKYSLWINGITGLMKKDLTTRFGINFKSKIMMKSFNNFGSIIPLKTIHDPQIIACTDGVGTKLIVAKNCNKLYNLGIDLVAMCVNDLYCCGGYPLAFIDYLGFDPLSKNSLTNEQKKEIIYGIIDGCRSSNCFLLGGETAEMSDIYKPGLFDLVGTAIGQVNYNQILPKVSFIQEGDLLIGFPSNGIHANGFSLIRKLIGDCPPKFLQDDLLCPTKIYKNEVEYLHKTFGNYLRALVHVTGGGIINNVERVLPNHLTIKLFRNQWPMPKIFQIIETIMNERGCDSSEMWDVFNMGLGLIAIISKKSKINHTVPVIGTVITKQD